MISFSYSSLNNIHNGHEWLNKQMSIPVPDYDFLREGKDGHRIIQDHVSGKQPHQLLAHIQTVFPVVEEKDFDKKCEFGFVVKVGNTKYKIFGYVDGLNEEHKNILEIKTSSSPWSIGKFKKSIQRKIYGLAYPNYKDSYLITCQRDLKKWEIEQPAIYSVPITNNDREEAMAWILEGISKFENGDFGGGLDENGKCTGCFWNMPKYRNLANCHFL